MVPQAPNPLHGVPPTATDPLMTVCIFCIGAFAAFVVLYLLRSDRSQDVESVLAPRDYELKLQITREPSSPYSPGAMSTISPYSYYEKMERGVYPSWTASVFGVKMRTL